MKKKSWIIKLAKLVWLTLCALLNPWSTRNIGIASRWGKLEHRFGRLIGVAGVVSFLAVYFKINYYVELVCIGSTVVFWAIYLISHTMEKKMYGDGLRASTKAGL